MSAASETVPRLRDDAAPPYGHPAPFPATWLYGSAALWPLWNPLFSRGSPHGNEPTVVPHVTVPVTPPRAAGKQDISSLVRFPRRPKKSHTHARTSRRPNLSGCSGTASARCTGSLRAEHVHGHLPPARGHPGVLRLRQQAYGRSAPEIGENKCASTATDLVNFTAVSHSVMCTRLVNTVCVHTSTNIPRPK